MDTLTQLFTGIARDHLGIETLQTRHRDALDFHDVSVAGVTAALEAAFDAGARSAGKAVESKAASPVRTAAESSALVPLIAAPLLPGKMYLRLYYRTDPDDEAEGWSFAGPTFGPLSCYVHADGCMYGEHDGEQLWLERRGDPLVWQGRCYSDLEGFIADPDAASVIPFNQPTTEAL